MRFFISIMSNSNKLAPRILNRKQYFAIKPQKSANKENQINTENLRIYKLIWIYLITKK